MAEGNEPQPLGSYAASSTKGEKIHSGSNLSISVTGKTVVVSYYIIVTTDMSKNDTIATLDIPTDFILNSYSSDINNKKAVNLLVNTKRFCADESIASGLILRGQIIGVMK